MSIEDEVARHAAATSNKDPRLAELERLAAELHSEGKDFRVEQGRVLTASRPTDRDRETVIDLGSDHIRMGLVSDSHAGSKFEQLTALRAFYRYADEQGVDFFLHGGDWTQGTHKMHRGMENELHTFGADAQSEYVIRTYPRSVRGAKTYGISGNHDDTWLSDGGVNVVRNIAKQRDDIEYVGQDAAYLTIGKLRMYLIHPDGGGSYAKSYKPQKVVEALPIDKKLALIAIGHYHSWGSFKHQRTHALMLPCFQGQYSWLARKGLNPDVGGMIVDLWLDDKGWPRRMAEEYVSFPTLENDWDYDVARELSRSWSSKGIEV